jgi:beta-barrel assembly-enhancing protease
MRKYHFAAVCALWLSVASLGMGASGCKARFPNMMSKEQEIQLGTQAKGEIDQQYRGKFVTSGPQYDRLQRVAARILPLAKRDFDVPYSIQLINDKQVNAFAVPGGAMYFYTGLVDLTSSDDELASVVGHEAAHIVKRHSAKQISDAQAKQLIAAIALGASGAGQAAQLGAGVLLQLEQLKFSRDDESQSDEVGFRYLVEAGYRPEAMASFFRKMAQASGGGGGSPEWLSSHPLTNNRVKAAERRAAEYRATQGR